MSLSVAEARASEKAFEALPATERIRQGMNRGKSRNKRLGIRNIGDPDRLYSRGEELANQRKLVGLLCLAQRIGISRLGGRELIYLRGEIELKRKA